MIQGQVMGEAVVPDTETLHDYLGFSLCTKKIGLIICPLAMSGFLDDNEQDVDINAV